MSSEEPFTSVRWDREGNEGELTSHQESISEERSEQNSPLLATIPNDSSSVHSETEAKSVRSDVKLGSEETECKKAPDSSGNNSGIEKGHYEDGQDNAGESRQAENQLRNEDAIQPIASMDSAAGVTGIDNRKETDSQTSMNTKPSVLAHDLKVTEDQEYHSTSESNHISQFGHRSTKIIEEESLNQKKMEEAFGKYKIYSSVSNPISDRDGNSKSFISYLVTTETNHPEVKKLSGNNQNDDEIITIKARRRYGDFRFLHDCLNNDFPQLLVPPLPPKSNFKYLTGDTFSTSFVHKRLHSLDRFISFICQHKLLSQSSVFHYFISDSSEWSTFTKNLKIIKGEDGDSSIMGKVVNEDLLTETIMNFFTPSKHKRETNKDILEISDKLKKLYENLNKLEKIFSKLNKKNSDLRTDYEHLSNQINKLASLHEQTSIEENHQTDPNVSIGSTVDEMQLNATTNFRIFSDSLLFFSENWSNISRYIDESFLVSLKDCAKYIARLSGLIELHHNKKIDLQVLEDYLAKAKNDLSNIGGNMSRNDLSSRAPPPNPALIGQGNGGLVNNTTQLIKDTLSTSATPHIGSSQTETKKAKLQHRIQQLENEIVAQTDLVNNLTNRIINEEYPNWNRFNKSELKKSMAELCDHEISFYKGLVDNWSDVEQKLMKRLEELE